MLCRNRHSLPTFQTKRAEYTCKNAGSRRFLWIVSVFFSRLPNVQKSIFFFTQKKKKKKKRKKKEKKACPTSGEGLICGYTKFVFTVDERKGRLNPSREKNEGKHRRRKVDEKSCATFLLCDPGWCVQNKWDDITHKHAHLCPDGDERNHFLGCGKKKEDYRQSGVWRKESCSNCRTSR